MKNCEFEYRFYWIIYWEVAQIINIIWIVTLNGIGVLTFFYKPVDPKKNQSNKQHQAGLSLPD
jgi:hypothetical protein